MKRKEIDNGNSSFILNDEEMAASKINASEQESDLATNEEETKESSFILNGEETTASKIKIKEQEELGASNKWLRRLTLVALAGILGFTVYTASRNASMNSAIEHDYKNGSLYMTDVPITEVTDYDSGYELLAGDLVKYETKRVIADVVNPTITTYYTVPSGYTLNGTTGYRTYINAQGEEVTETIEAEEHTTCTVPAGYVLENGKGVKYTSTQTDIVISQLTEVKDTFFDDYGHEMFVTERISCDKLAQDYILINGIYIKKQGTTSLTNETFDIAIELSEDEQVPNGFVKIGNYAVRESVLKYIPSLTQENTQTKSK